MPVGAEASEYDAFGECHFTEFTQLVDIIQCQSARFLFEADSVSAGRQCGLATEKPAFLLAIIRIQKSTVVAVNHCYSPSGGEEVTCAKGSSSGVHRELPQRLAGMNIHHFNEVAAFPVMECLYQLLCLRVVLQFLPGSESAKAPGEDDCVGLIAR